MAAGVIHKFNQQAGFTLLEVLAAFAVFALTFGVVLQILSGSIQSAVRSAEYTEAALWAESIMGRVGLEIPVEDGSESGDFNDQFSYALTIEPWEMDEQEGLVTNAVPVELFRVQVQVVWGNANRPRSARFVTLKAGQGAER